MSADALPSVDGRRARRDQNRESVVDALLDLYRGGDIEPSVAAVAERSGVSHRSVFRYFEDLDELYRVAIERHYQAIADRLHISEIGQGPLDKRIAALVANRLELYDVAAPVARVGHMKAPTEPVLLDNIRDMLDRAREQVDRHFANELGGLPAPERDAIAEAVTAAVSMETMELLRFLRQLPRDEAEAAIGITVRRLLGG
ncbi:MAG: TetR/AcrR family transcriptional regulator [Actinomycetota bacterium]